MLSHKWLCILTILFLFVLLIAITLKSGFDRVSRKGLVQEIALVSKKDFIRKFDDVFPNLEWNYVCKLEEYGLPSERLSFYFRENALGDVISEFEYHPFDRRMIDNEAALAFVSIENRSVELRTISIGKKISRFEGPSCLKGKEATFIVESAGNAMQLRFIGDR